MLFQIFLFFIGIGFDGIQGGQLPTSRVKRKRQQLENIMAFVIPFLQPGGSPPTSGTHKKKVVVDFCCGYETYLLLNCTHCVILITIKVLFLFSHYANICLLCCMYASCGHQSIPLAFLFPEVTFILIDTNTR